MRNISIALALLGLVGCGDDDASDGGTVDDASVVDDAGVVDDTGTAEDVPADVPAVLGCVAEPTLCTSTEMCCAGVPYPTEGICQDDGCPMDSDRDIKHGLESVDGDALLERLSRLPVTEWSYNAQPDVRHMGPMAQDFREAFGLGTSDRTIHPVDANGVLIGALQALTRRVEALEEENRRLRAQSR